MSWTYISEIDAFEIYHKVQEEAAKGGNEDSFSFLFALRNAAAGAGGTAVSNVLTYPLDLVCTRLQVQSKKPPSSSTTTTSSSASSSRQYDGVLDAIRKIYETEGGITAFYNGLFSDTCKSVIDSFLFFLVYNVIGRTKKQYIPATKQPILQALDGLSTGFLAGAFTKAFTTPIQIVVTRQQTQTAAEEQSAKEIVDTIYKREGIRGFWRGYSASLFLTMNPALTFFLDAALRRALRAGEKSSPVITFILAANGKATANVIMYPFKLAKARAQVASVNEDEEQQSGERKGRSNEKLAPKTQTKKVPTNPVAAIRHIASTEGVSALYAGVWGELLKGFFSHGITMLVKEQIPAVVLQLYYLLSNLLQRRSKLKV